ncbi:MAG TPA: hypothetical protein VKF82_11275 [Candidatus Eremiobacteraceae bacterium]|nr:hypothetical protein [Candidatus Eremiobacteraceae bacterium]
MNLKDASLIEIAALASKELEAAGIKAAVVGGSAVTAYVPDVYTSHDIDFAAINGASRREFGDAVAKIGFRASGRDFVHPEVAYSLDLVADTPFVDQRAIKDFTTLPTRFGTVRVLHFEDAIADRIAAFLHWADSQSLEVAERAVQAHARRVSWNSLERALDDLDASAPDGAARLALAKRRLRAAAKVGRSLPE